MNKATTNKLLIDVVKVATPHPPPTRFVAAIYCITGSMDSCSKTHLEGLLFDPEELSCDDDDDALLNLLSRLWNGERSRRVLLANG